MLEEFCISKYREIILKCLKKSQRQKYQTEKTEDEATGETLYVAASYSANSLVMITHESEWAFLTNNSHIQLVLLDLSF